MDQNRLKPCRGDRLVYEPSWNRRVKRKSRSKQGGEFDEKRENDWTRINPPTRICRDNDRWCAGILAHARAGSRKKLQSFWQPAGHDNRTAGDSKLHRWPVVGPLERQRRVAALFLLVRIHERFAIEQASVGSVPSSFAIHGG